MGSRSILEFIGAEVKKRTAATIKRLEGACPFYQPCNGRGQCRCVFIAPEEWVLRRERLEQFCLSNGRGCPVLAHVMSLLGGGERG